MEAAAAFCRQRPFWRQSFTNLHQATMDGPRFPFLLDLAHPVSIRNANTDCDENRKRPRLQEKRVLDVLQLDRWGDFVTSLLTSVRERGREGGSTSVTDAINNPLSCAWWLGGLVDAGAGVERE